MDSQIGSKKLRNTVDIILDQISIGHKDNRIWTDSVNVAIVNYDNILAIFKASFNVTHNVVDERMLCLSQPQTPSFISFCTLLFNFWLSIELEMFFPMRPISTDQN